MSRQKIAKTIDDAAAELKVHARTLARWQVEDGFPGKAGTPGQRDGRYPISDIKIWHYDNKRGSSDSAQQRHVEIKSIEAELDLKERLGQVVQVDDVAALLQRVISISKAQLEELPDKIVARVSHLDPELQREIRQDVDMDVRNVLLTIGTLLEGDDD